MGELRPTDAVAGAAAPELSFAVLGADTVAYAAVPTLSFRLGIESGDARPVRSVLLDVQIQIAARRRGYESEARDRLLEVFGPVDQWSTTLRTLPWVRTTLVVPPFTEATAVDLPVTCTYDLEVTAARYLAALAGGEVPLEFLFSGSVFFAGGDGRLQTARIGWDREAAFALPVATWRATMDRHFPGAAWLRLGADSFGALAAFKARHTYASWDAAIDALLAAGGDA